MHFYAKSTFEWCSLLRVVRNSFADKNPFLLVSYDVALFAIFGPHNLNNKIIILRISSSAFHNAHQRCTSATVEIMAELSSCAKIFHLNTVCWWREECERWWWQTNLAFYGFSPCLENNRNCIFNHWVITASLNTIFVSNRNSVPWLGNR